MIIGSNVTAGWQLVPQGNSVCVGAFGKMSGSHCRRFRPSPYPLPLLLFCHSSQFSSRSRAFGKRKETAATQANEFTLPFTLSFLVQLKRYIKHSRQCFIGFPNTSIEFCQKYSARRRIFNSLLGSTSFLKRISLKMLTLKATTDVSTDRRSFSSWKVKIFVRV